MKLSEREKRKKIKCLCRDFGVEYLSLSMFFVLNVKLIEKYSIPIERVVGTSTTITAKTEAFQNMFSYSSS